MFGIDIAGSTLGCFGAGCTPVAAATLGGLTFMGGVFAGQTDTNGEFAAGVAGNNLGVFTLDATPFSYTDAFTLRLILTDPAPGNGPTGATFSADISGVVSSGTSGTISVTWPGICHGCGNPPVHLYDFSIPAGDGTIGVHINPRSFSLSAGSAAPQISIQDGHFHTDIDTVPEPATFVLLAGAFAGLAALRHRRVR